MTISEFIWPQDRIEHIGKHGVEPNEVEEVCFGQAFVQRAKSKGTILFSTCSEKLHLGVISSAL